MVLGRRPVARLAADLAGVTSGDRVVDVGCGPGAAVREAARRGAEATGVDPAPVMLGFARRLTRRTDAVEWLEGVAENLPRPDGSATVVWSLATVHHWPDLEGGLAEVHRVLTPGGRFVAIERSSRPGAKGLASHGWTNGQAEAFAECCRAAAFTDVEVETHKPRRVVQRVVRARTPR